MQDIKQIINHLKDQAQKAMRRNGGELEPKMYFLILYPGQKTPVYYPIQCADFFSSSLNKSLLPEHSQYSWDKKKRESPAGIELVAVCLISDTWQSSLDVKELNSEEISQAINTAVLPSRDPKRLEAICITVCYRSEEIGYLQFYKRLNKKVNFGELIGPAPRVGLNIGNLYPKNP